MNNQINEDLKLALKNQDKFTLSVLRLLKSELVSESRKGQLHELTDEEVMKVIKHQVKVRKDSIEEFKKYEKHDLVESLEKEVEVLNKYLPAQMSEEEVLKVIDEVFISENPESMKDMGRIMKVISSKLPNADMGFVSKTIKDRLS